APGSARSSAARPEARTMIHRVRLIGSDAIMVRLVVRLEDLVLEVAELGLAGNERQDKRVTLVRCAELAFDVLDMNAHRVGTYIEFLGALFLGMTAAAEDETIALPPRQNIATLCDSRPLFKYRRHSDAPFSASF